MKTKFKAYITAATLLIGFGVLGCSGENPNLIPNPPPPKKITDGKNAGKVFSPKVDILFVVDSSGSMMIHQQNLSSNVALFADKITQNTILDYHIGVITTDDEPTDFNGKLVGSPLYVEKSTVDAVAKLSANLIVGTWGSPFEKVFDPVISAFSPPIVNGHNDGFLRSNAYLALVIVTDAEDQSRAYDLAQTISFLNTLKGDSRLILAYGVIVPSNVTNCSRDDYSKPAKIEGLIQNYGGLIYNLCDPNFGANLALIGDDLRRNTVSFIPLNEVPIVETITVQYGSQTIPADLDFGWSYDPRRIGLRLAEGLTLDPEPDGTEFKVQYVPYEAPKP